MAPRLSHRVWVLAVLALAGARPLAAQEQSVSAEELFARRVLPLLKARCFPCHGGDAQEVRGGLNMLSRDGLLKGGDSATASVVPGKPEASPLYLAVRRADDLWPAMPPKDNDKLTSAEVESIRQWIAGGAPWPSQERLQELLRNAADQWNASEGVPVATSGGLTDEWTRRRYRREDLWAYQPLRKDWADVGEEGGRNVVDVWIDQKLAELHLQPAPPADRRTLIRRATFDLLGLPPAPEEIDAFVGDPAPDDAAFAALVERLLASPHYGEQWGRRWLDVVRYADSSGYANDYERGNAWRYRDYVVRAFNADKPYDQFIREQLAGDEIDPHNPELLVAVGFLRMGPWELTGMEVPKVARQRFLDDVTDAVGQVFLAHMLQCARCHDHKFDPVPTRDYYSIQAVFATTQPAERPAAFLEAENTAGFEEKKYLELRRDHYRRVLIELERKRTIAAARGWLAENRRDAAPFEQALQALQGQPGRNGRDVSLDELRAHLQQRQVPPDLIPPRHVGFAPRDFGLERVARKGLERLKWTLERYEPFALSVYSGRTPNLKNVSAPQRMPADRLQAGELEQTCILAGGDPFSPGQPVQPGVLSAVEMWNRDSISQSAFSIPQSIEGRRLALARWIASPDHPLTARVMANRVWQGHFGRGIAGNPNNFGATGRKPTHPELLDVLAARFVAGGWSVKSLHRLIMNSQAYRRSSRHPDPQALAEQDADGTSYAVFRPRRLDAEELRDAMLWTSGELNPAVGGIPIRPEMNLEAALQPRQLMGTFAEAWQPSPLPQQRHRRSLYVLKLRGQRDPFLEVFNAPSPDLSCEAREASTVTLQVFALFNSQATFDRALAFAHRLLQEHKAGGGGRPSEEPRRDAPGGRTVRDRRQPAIIDRAFRLAFGRPATLQELDACLAHWDKMTARHRELRFEPPQYPREIVREAVEENTGERFTFTEPLEVYADFVPDLKPGDADPELRGLAEVCLVLLNSNEFAYVY